MDCPSDYEVRGVYLHIQHCSHSQAVCPYFLLFSSFAYESSIFNSLPLFLWLCFSRERELSYQKNKSRMKKNTAAAATISRTRATEDFFDVMLNFSPAPLRRNKTAFSYCLLSISLLRPLAAAAAAVLSPTFSSSSSSSQRQTHRRADLPLTSHCISFLYVRRYFVSGKGRKMANKQKCSSRRRSLESIVARACILLFRSKLLASRCWEVFYIDLTTAPLGAICRH